jgi:hypothetical protein
MVITGERHRTIYPQKSINWTSSYEITNTYGKFSASFSGIGGNCNVFTLHNGKVLSPKNEMVGSYLNNETLSLSGNIGTKTLDLYKNNVPLYLGLERTTTGDLNTVILNDVSGQSVTLNNLTLIGGVPELIYNKYLTFNTGDTIPFTIYNTGLNNLTIFSGAVNNSNFTLIGIENLTVPASGSGTFFVQSLLSGITYTPQDIPILIDSSIGKKNLLLQISGILPQDNLYYISLGPEDGSVYDATYNTYNVSIGNPSGVGLSIGLNYISGITGDYYRITEATGFKSSGIVSGFISGTGYLNGNITGVISGFNTLNSQYEFGVGTGNAYSLYKISDDKLVTGFYSVLGTGIGNISGQSGVTGYFYLTGITGGLSETGYYKKSFIVTGSGYYVDSDNYPYYPLVTGTKQASGIVFVDEIKLNSFDYISINNRPIYYNSGTNYLPPNYFNSRTGLINIVNNYTGIFLCTGFSFGSSGVILNSLLIGNSGNFIGLAASGSGVSTSSPTLIDGKTYYLQMSPSGNFSGIASVSFASTGYYTGYSSGNITGYINKFTGVRRFTGIWDIQTGSNFNFISYRDNNLLSGINYYNSIQPSPTGSNSALIQVRSFYSNSLNTLQSEQTDVADIVISGVNFGPSGSGINFRLVGIKNL